MRNLVRWMAGLAGIAALAKLVRARSQSAPALSPPERADDDPADALRRKLADARSVTPDPPGDSAAATPDEPALSLEERRAEIHARAQDAIDAMRSDDA